MKSNSNKYHSIKKISNKPLFKKYPKIDLKLVVGVALVAVIGAHFLFQSHAATSSAQPISDVQASHIVGVGKSTTAFYKDVSDGTSFASSDDNVSYVRGESGVTPVTHTVGYGSLASTTVLTQATVNYRAYRGSADGGTIQVQLYNGSQLIGTGKKNTLGDAYTNYTDTFTGLNIAGAQLSTKITMTNTGESGAPRYTNIWVDAGLSDTPPPPPADTTPPTIPTAVTAALAASSGNTVVVNWGPSTDNVAVSKYIITRTDSSNNIVTFSVPFGINTYTDSSTVASTKYSYTVAAQDSANNISAQSAAAIVTTPTVNATPAIIHAAFYYPWFPETWGSLTSPDTKYHPTLGYYNSSDPTILAKHVAEMQYANLDAAISSWWGQGQHQENTRFPAQLAAAKGTNFKWTLYYEKEGSGNPTVTDITSDLNYIKSNYASNPNYLTIKTKPVIFVYGDANDGCSMADRWKQANAAVGNSFYVVLKVFSGYQSCASQPDSWHQYAPASYVSAQGNYAVAISPGFNKYSESAPRLVRSLSTWNQSINTMLASKDPLQLITTFNEWGEGTAVESAQEWSSTSGYGAYVDALHNLLPAVGTTTPPPPPSDSTPPSVPTSVKAAISSSASNSVVVTWGASTDNVAVSKYIITRTDPQNNIVTFTVPFGTNTYTDSSTLFSTKYSYSVAAQDTSGNNSANSVSATVTTPTPADTTPPSVPTSVTAALVSSTTNPVVVNWGASTDNVAVKQYIVSRTDPSNTTVKFIVPFGTNTYTDSSTVSSTKYSYTVAAQDTSLNTSAASAAVSVTTPTPVIADTTPPSVPTSVTAALVSTTGNPVVVKWGASTDNVAVKQYIVTRTAGSSVVNFTVPFGTNTYTDSSTVASTKYSYNVSAQDTSLNTSAASAAATVTTPTPVVVDTSPPNVPTATTTIVSPTQVTISWNAVVDNPTTGGASGVKGYKVFRDGTQIADVTTTSVNDGPFSFVTGQSYKYTVLAYDVAGNQSAQSSGSSVIPNPTVVTGSSVCHNSPTGNKIDTVVVISEENRTWSGGASPAVGLGFNVTNMPYLHSIAAQCTYFTQDTETNTSDNSAQQYVGAWTGYTSTTTNVSNDCSPSTTCSYTGNNIFRSFRNANIPHREYVEGTTASCSASGNAPKHIPDLYMWDTTDKSYCASEVLPISQFNFATPPTGFTFITPTLCNDGHDCSDNTVDKWLSDPTRLPAIFNSAAYKSGKVLVEIWYDEDHAKPNMFACYSCNTTVNTTTDPHYSGESLQWLNLLGAPSSNLGGISTGTDIRPIVGTP